MLKFSLFLIFLAQKSSSSAVYNYCNQDLCSHSGHKHISCGAYGDFSPSCSYDANIVELTHPDQQKILNLHNKFRNKIGSGDEEGFDKAVRMTTMQWSTDLAGYAGLNVRRCKVQHDCHNTPEMKFSGQNLFYKAKTDLFEHNIAAFIDSAVTSWWNEREDATQKEVDECCGEGATPNFLTLIHEKANRVGCAIAQFQGAKGKTTYMVCNYSYSTIKGEKVYESGEAASKCEKGINENYSALCSETEEIDWNKIADV